MSANHAARSGGLVSLTRGKALPSHEHGDADIIGTPDQKDKSTRTPATITLVRRIHSMPPRRLMAKR
jgi:hypothetical protein